MQPQKYTPIKQNINNSFEESRKELINLFDNFKINKDINKKWSEDLEKNVLDIVNKLQGKQNVLYYNITEPN